MMTFLLIVFLIVGTILAIGLLANIAALLWTLLPFIIIAVIVYKLVTKHKKDGDDK